MAYGSGGRYPEELNPSGGEIARDESYPKGKSMSLPAGKLSMYLPGNGETTISRTMHRHERSSSHCGDAMSSMVPGAASGKTTYKHDGD